MHIHTAFYSQLAVKRSHIAIMVQTVKRMTTASVSALVDDGPSQSEQANWGLPQSNTPLYHLSSATEAVK